jgi:hypothetical protein
MEHQSAETQSDDNLNLNLVFLDVHDPPVFDLFLCGVLIVGPPSLICWAMFAKVVGEITGLGLIAFWFLFLLILVLCLTPFVTPKGNRWECDFHSGCIRTWRMIDAVNRVETFFFLQDVETVSTRKEWMIWWRDIRVLVLHFHDGKREHLGPFLFSDGNRRIIEKLGEVVVKVSTCSVDAIKTL